MHNTGCFSQHQFIKASFGVRIIHPLLSVRLVLLEQAIFVSATALCERNPPVFEEQTIAHSQELNDENYDRSYQ